MAIPRSAFALAIATLLVCTARSHAQTPAAETPAATAWDLHCTDDGKCEMLSRYEIDGKPVSHLALYKVGDSVVLEYLLPLRVNLQKGIFLVVDGKKRFATNALYCDAPGCVGYAPATAELVASLQRGADLRLVFAMQGDTRVFLFAYPLTGFTATYRDWKAGKKTSQGQ